MNWIFKLRKKIISLYYFLTFGLLFTRAAYAQYLTDDPPPLVDIVGPFVRILNGLVLAGGMAFVIMIAVSAFKFAMAQGDPKAMEGAKQSLTYAVYGAVVLVSIYAIQWILASAFGLDGAAGNPNSFVNTLRESITGLRDAALGKDFEKYDGSEGSGDKGTPDQGRPDTPYY